MYPTSRYGARSFALTGGVVLLLGAAGCTSTMSTWRTSPVRAQGDVLSRATIPTQEGERPIMMPADRRAPLASGRGGGPLDSDTVGGEVHVRLHAIERRVRDDVARGALGEQALDVFLAGQRDVLATLRLAGRDGSVDGQEQQQLGVLLRDLENECYQSVQTLRIGPTGPLHYWSPQE